MPSPQSQETVLLEELVRSNEGGRVTRKAQAQFAGRLVLTDRRLIFLSSGKGAGRLGRFAPVVFYRRGLAKEKLRKPAGCITHAACARRGER